jgi:aminoacrylate hydrolase
MPRILAGTQELRYELHGSGPAAVFVTGLGGDLRQWHWQLPAHARELRCLLYDHRWTGGSRSASGATSPQLSLETLAADLEGLLDALEIERAHVIGASMGGTVAQLFALRCPERVSSLCLHSTWARTSAALRLKLQSQIDLLQKIELPELLLGLAPWIWSEETLVERPEVIAAFREVQRVGAPAIDKEVYILQARACLELDLSAELQGIEAPTLVTAGAEDLLIRPSDSELIHRRIPASVFHRFEGCGHASLVEKAEEFNAVSLEFLRAHGG